MRFPRSLVALPCLLLMAFDLGAQGLGSPGQGDDLRLLGRSFGEVLAARGSPATLGREAGFVDPGAVSRFFGQWSTYWVTCDDKYTFNSPLLLDLAAQVSARPLRRGFVVLGYGDRAFWIDEVGRVAALAYPSLPAGLTVGGDQGRLEGFRRYAPPPGRSGLGDILLGQGSDGSPLALVFSPHYLLPEVQENDPWGLGATGRNP